MKLITNQNESSHISIFIPLIESSEQIWLAVAFLTNSGWIELKDAITKALKKGTRFKIVSGLNFGLTDPQVLLQIKKLFDKYSESQLWLVNTEGNHVFHPKVWLFQNKKEVTVISGSANFTRGGLIGNEECSIMVTQGSTSNLATSALHYFDNLIDSENAVLATKLTIGQYKLFYEQQRQYRKNQRANPVSKIGSEFNYKKLLGWYKEYVEFNDVDELYNARVREYKKARKVLDEISSTKLTKARFRELYELLVTSKGVNGLWHSGSLYRLRGDVIDDYKNFQKLVRYVKANLNTSVVELYNGSINLVDDIYGAGPNVVTEILMTYKPTKFANLNANPIKVLKEEGQVSMKAHSESFNGADYEAYCELVEEISSKLNLRSMLEADSFFNNVYWNLKKIENEQ